MTQANEAGILRILRGSLLPGATGMSSMRKSLSVWVGAAAAVTLLAGCGNADEQSAQAMASTSAGATKGASVGASKVRSDMVSAVSASKVGPPVELKFALQERPQVGEPVDVEVALIPVTPLTRLFVRFQPSSGLTLVKGAESPQFERPATGEAIRHVVTVMANHDGIFYISAAVVADSEESSLTRSFSIPLIAGNGVAAPPKPTALAVEAPAAR